MKIIILGAGALGSLIGGYLAHAGFDVTLLGRPQHRQAIEEQGLHITGAHEFIAHPQVSDDPGSVREADLLLICVRTINLQRALQDVAYLQPNLVASFQNGVTIDETLAARFGRRSVLGAVTTLGALMSEPAHVRCTVLGHTWFGELDGRRSRRLQGVIHLWQTAQLPVQSTPDIAALQWSKLAYLAPLSILSGLTRLPYHQILQSSDLAYLFIQMMREINIIARAYTINLQDMSGIPAQTLVTVPFPHAQKMLIARGQALAAHSQKDVSTNLLRDVLCSRPTEIETIAGDVVRMAQDAGLSVPALSFAYRAIRGIDHWAGN